MSKRHHDTSGAFDALVDAIVGLGAGTSSAALPPATAPGSLGRGLAQGVIQGRFANHPKGARPIDPSAVPVTQIQHEGQRSVAELGAMLWHALGGGQEAPELAPWIIPPHTDPIIALTLSRQRIAEYTQREPVDRTCAFPGARVWLVEIERAKGDVPAGIAVWRSRGTNGDWKVRCACLWTQGRIGSPQHPLVIGAQWNIDGSNATAGACMAGPNHAQATRASMDAARNAVLTRRQNAIGKQMIAQIVLPAVFAWLDHHNGIARPAGRFAPAETPAAGNGATAQSKPGQNRSTHTVHPVPAATRTPPPRWLTAQPERAVEAIVIGAAREGFRIGASCPVAQWRHGWAGYAEMGAVAWHAIADLNAQIDARAWRAMEDALDENRLENQCVHPALAATSALVRKMLVQTQRNHAARATDDRMLCALEVPERLWRALGEAGPCPEPPAEPNLDKQWWLVEIEHPAEDEPKAIALWQEDDAEVTLAAFNGIEDGHGGSWLTVVTWRTTPDGTRTQPGLAALRCPVHVDDPDNPESAAGLALAIETLAAPATGPIARVKTAISLHLASNDKPEALGPYRPSTPDARTPNDMGSTEQASITTLFALKRAPNPKGGDEDPTGKRGHGRGGGQKLLARQEVEPHWKRQAYGPKLSRWRWIVIERYERGPPPEEDQIVITRLAERQRDGAGQSAEARNREEKRRRRRNIRGSRDTRADQQP